MASQDDIEDIKELTRIHFENIVHSLEDLDDSVKKSILCSVFSSLIYNFFETWDQREQFILRVIDCIEVLQEANFENIED